MAGECEDATVVNEPVNDGGCGHLIGGDLGAFFKRQIGRKRDAPPFVSLLDELKEQVFCLAFEWNISEFVDEE